MLDKWPAHSRFAFVMLVGAILLAAFAAVLMRTWGRGLSPEFEFIYQITLAVVVAYWLEYDTRMTGLMRVWDWTWFFFAAWPIVAPYYLIKARGARKGLKTILAWLGGYALRHVLAAILRAALSN